MSDHLADLDFGPYQIDPASVKLLPRVFCLTHDVLLLGEVDPDADTPVVVGLAKPNDLETLDAVTRVMHGRRVLPVKVSAEKIQKALALAYGLDKLADVQDYQRQDPPQEKDNEVLLDDRMADSQKPPRKRIHAIDATVDSESPIKSLVNDLLVNALRRGATDIHIETFRYGVTTRIKLDGLLHRIKSGITVENADEVIVRLKVLSNLDISERRAPQDGRIVMRIDQDGKESDVPFRISIIPGPYGEDAVLRVLDKSMAPIDLELLGFAKNDLERFKQLLENPQGLVLNSGPTGSGKTTTLYASLKHINNPHIKILSAEDPIEYDLDGVSQKQINVKLGFAELARAFLRHDPDVLLIGEIRDPETADVAAKAAQTGHLVLSTLHTNDAVGATARLKSMGLDSEIIASVLLGVLSQRLIRRICPKCQQPYIPEKNVREAFGNSIEGMELVRGARCATCNHTGYRGRIGLFELLIVDDEMQMAIHNEMAIAEMQSMAVAKGMKPLIKDGLLKVRHKITTLEELMRVIPYRQIMANLRYS